MTMLDRLASTRTRVLFAFVICIANIPMIPIYWEVVAPSISHHRIGARTLPPKGDQNVEKTSHDVATEGELQQREGELPLCPATPPDLKGPIEVVVDPVPSWEELARSTPELLPGGRWRPKHCRARHRVAIVIPYRDRGEQLRIFLRHMHPVLQRQQLHYGIYVIEQAAPTIFNRAMLMNTGFVEANQADHYDCTVFHDVDILPEDDRAVYNCSEQPRHMPVALDKHGYKLKYPSLFGGIVVFKTEQFQKVNGFSNVYFGWGGEDDDLYRRVERLGFKIQRYPASIGRFKSLKHVREIDNTPGENRTTLLRQWERRRRTDGLNSLEYTLLDVKEKHWYTWVHVHIDGPKG